MSAKSVAEKLLVKSDARVWSSHPQRLELVGPLPPGARVVSRPEEATTALVFADDAASFRAVLAANADHLSAPGMLWVAYPKGNRADINRDSVWPMLAEHGMRPIAQVALDDVWSALRFRPSKPGEPPFSGGKTR